MMRRLLRIFLPPLLLVGLTLFAIGYCSDPLPSTPTMEDGRP